MPRKNNSLPGTDHIDDLAKAVAEGWREQVGELDVGAVGLFTRMCVLARLGSAFYENALKDTDRNDTEYFVLAMLRALGPRTPTELNVALIQTSGGVTNTLTRLEKAGLVTRRRAGADRRSVQVSLTPSGKKEADRTMSIVGRGIESCASNLSHAQRDRAKRALNDLIATLINS